MKYTKVWFLLMNSWEKLSSIMVTRKNRVKSCTQERNKSMGSQDANVSVTLRNLTAIESDMI